MARTISYEIVIANRIDRYEYRYRAPKRKMRANIFQNIL